MEVKEYLKEYLCNQSVDPNANKTSIDAEGICDEATLPFKKLVGYGHLYQTLKELYGKSEEREEEIKKIRGEPSDI